MKFLVTAFSILAVLVASQGATLKDGIDLRNSPTYGYLTRVGLPLAAKILEVEIQSMNSSVPEQQTHKTVGPFEKIIDGQAAQLGDIPYQVALLIDLDTGKSLCGGSLLNARRVLTAAHCWWDGQSHATRFTVVLGSVKLYTGGTRIQTSKVVTHSGWDPIQTIHDIAMAYLPTDVQFSDTIKPVALPSHHTLHENFVGQTVVASGFGITRDDGATTTRTYLSYVNLKVISNEECRRTFPIRPTIVCTIGDNKKNVCGGDSGGPLVVSSDNKPVLIGLTSFGAQSCERGHPSAFTRVTSYMDWINDRLNN